MIIGPDKTGYSRESFCTFFTRSHLEGTEYLKQFLWVSKICFSANPSLAKLSLQLSGAIEMPDSLGFLIFTRK